jgi:hypothetical protein
MSEVFIRKATAVYRLPTFSIPCGYVTALNNVVFDDAMDCCSLVVKIMSSNPLSFFTCAKTAEVLRRFGAI